jgi:hypothetical protein
LAIGLMGAGLSAGFWAAELLDGTLPMSRGAIGFIATGLTMLSGDVVSRKYGGTDRDFARYLSGSKGPSLKGLPVSVIGLLFVVMGAGLID